MAQRYIVTAAIITGAVVIFSYIILGFVVVKYLKSSEAPEGRYHIGEIPPSVLNNTDHFATDDSYRAQIALAQRQVAEGRFAAAWATLARTCVVRRGWEWRYLVGLCISKENLNKMPAVPTTDAGDMLDFTRFAEYVDAAEFSLDGSRLVTISPGCSIKVWDSETNAEVASFRSFVPYLSPVALSPNGSKIILVFSGITPWLWNIDSQKIIAVLEGHEGNINDVTFSPDGRMIASASSDHTVRLWDADKGSQIRVLSGHSDWVFKVVFSPDGARLLTCSRDGTIRIWSADSDREIFQHSEDAPIVHLSICPLGTSFFSLTLDQGILKGRIRNLETGELLTTLEDQDLHVIKFPFNTAATRRTGSSKGEAVIWDVNTGETVLRLASAYLALFHPDGHRLLLFSENVPPQTFEAPDLPADINVFENAENLLRAMESKRADSRKIRAAHHFDDSGDVVFIARSEAEERIGQLLRLLDSPHESFGAELDAMPFEVTEDLVGDVMLRMGFSVGDILTRVNDVDTPSVKACYDMFAAFLDTFREAPGLSSLTVAVKRDGRIRKMCYVFVEPQLIHRSVRLPQASIAMASEYLSTEAAGAYGKDFLDNVDRETAQALGEPWRESEPVDYWIGDSPGPIDRRIVAALGLLRGDRVIVVSGTRVHGRYEFVEQLKQVYSRSKNGHGGDWSILVQRGPFQLIKLEAILQ